MKLNTLALFTNHHHHQYEHCALRHQTASEKWRETHNEMKLIFFDFCLLLFRFFSLLSEKARWLPRAPLTHEISRLKQQENRIQYDDRRSTFLSFFFTTKRLWTRWLVFSIAALVQPNTDFSFLWRRVVDFSRVGRAGMFDDFDLQIKSLFGYTHFSSKRASLFLLFPFSQILLGWQCQSIL